MLLIRVHPLTSGSVCRVIPSEVGRKLAGEWSASFVESSAKQNEVLFLLRLLYIDVVWCPVQEVDVIFQRVLQEIEKQHGTHDDGGCVLL